MKKIWNYITMIGYQLAFAWLMMTAIGGTAGIVTACILIGMVAVALIWGGVDKKDVNAPLLLDLLMMASNVVLLEYPFFWPFTVSIAVAGLSDIIGRIVNHSYNTESVGAFISSELRLTPFLDIVFLFLDIIAIFREELYANPLVWILPAFFLFDFLRQKLSKRPDKQHIR